MAEGGDIELGDLNRDREREEQMDAEYRGMSDQELDTRQKSLYAHRNRALKDGNTDLVADIDEELEAVKRAINWRNGQQETSFGGDDNLTEEGLQYILRPSSADPTPYMEPDTFADRIVEVNRHNSVITTALRMLGEDPVDLVNTEAGHDVLRLTSLRDAKGGGQELTFYKGRSRVVIASSATGEWLWIDSKPTGFFKELLQEARDAKEHIDLVRIRPPIGERITLPNGQRVTIPDKYKDILTPGRIKDALGTDQNLREFAGVTDPSETVLRDQGRVQALQLERRKYTDMKNKLIQELDSPDRAEEVDTLLEKIETLDNIEDLLQDEMDRTSVNMEIKKDVSRFERFKKFAKANLLGLTAIATAIAGVITSIVVGLRKGAKKAADACGGIAKALYNIGKDLWPIVRGILGILSTLMGASSDSLHWLSRNLWALLVLVITAIYFYNKK